MTGHAAPGVPGVPGDSAGVPWAGRTLSAQPFPGDDGSAEPSLIAALAAGDPVAIVAAWAPTRVLVPIVAVLGEGEDDALVAAHGDKSADMALVTVTGPDGVRTLPTFSSVASLAGWNPAARPVPVEAARAAQAAVVEGCDRLVIDPSGPHPALLERPMIWAVAQGRDWLPPADDPQVRAAVAEALVGVAPVQAHRCLAAPGAPAGLVVVLGLAPGLEQAELETVVGTVGERLAAQPLIAERSSALQLQLRPV